MKKLLIALVLFCLCEVAEAATTRTVYVNTDGSNGDGSSGSPYSTLYNALNAETKDLVSNDRVLLIYVRGTAADTTDISAKLEAFAGYTDATRYLRIVGDPAQSSGAHAGLWSTSKYRLTGTSDNVILLTDSSSRLDYRIENIQMANVGTENFRRVLHIDHHHGEVYLIGNIIKSNLSGSPYGDNQCVRLTQETSTYKITSLYLINNVIADCKGQCVKWSSAGTGEKFIAFNNTISNCGNSEYQANLNINCQTGSSEVVSVKNNLLQTSNSGDQYIREYTCDTLATGNNLTGDASSPDSAYRSKTITFTDAANCDFHTSDIDSVDDGANLSADTYYAFSTDYERDTRSGDWDIGADETAGSSGPTLMILKYAREN